MNRVHHSDWMENNIPDKSIQLILADPPYFEVKGEFDFIWKSFDDYLKDVEKWAIECKRVLADNGSLLWWGHAKKIAYSQIIFDKYFNLGNSLIWEKSECQTKAQDYDQARHFAPITERCLFFTNEIEKSGLEEIMSNPEFFISIKEYLWSEYDKSGLTLKTANELMELATTGANLAGEMFGKNRDRFCFPTIEKYKLLQHSGYFKKPYQVLRSQYEDLRKKYESAMRPFNNSYKLTDVIKSSQESQISSQYDHETIKPLTLTKKLIQTTTRKGDLVLIPFGGSGTSVEACISTGRKYICYEIEKKHYNTIKSRENYALMQGELF